MGLDGSLDGSSERLDRNRVDNSSVRPADRRWRAAHLSQVTARAGSSLRLHSRHCVGFTRLHLAECEKIARRL